jgi:membrane peptidoglycan carboxypeptidase
LPLPAESPGKVYRLEKWGKTSLASVSMGQEVSVTTVQLAQAASAVANGGMLVKPRLVMKRDNRVEPLATPVRILKPETTFTMRRMMEEVVLTGTGSRARLTGYSSAGKTGSAQIYDYAGKHYTHTYNGSFMGFAPVTNPRVVVVVTLNGTHGESGFGGSSAAPVFKVVTAEALRVGEVPKDLPETIPNTLVAKNAADLNDLAVNDLERLNEDLLADDEEEVAATPSPLNPLAQGPPVAVVPVSPASPKPQGPRVPNFRGMTMRAVLAEAAAKGLSILPDGSGIARVQSPPPGAPLHQGERIRVQFAQ